jgi:hypothetical protein
VWQAFEEYRLLPDDESVAKLCSAELPAPSKVDQQAFQREEEEGRKQKKCKKIRKPSKKCMLL